MEKLRQDPLTQQNALDAQVEQIMADITKLPEKSPKAFDALRDYRVFGFDEKTVPAAIPEELLTRLRTHLGPHWRAVFAKFDKAFPKKD